LYLSLSLQLAPYSREVHRKLPAARSVYTRSSSPVAVDAAVDVVASEACLETMRRAEEALRSVATVAPEEARARSPSAYLKWQTFDENETLRTWFSHPSEHK
jgi:hypothetical protein